MDPSQWVRVLVLTAREGKARPSWLPLADPQEACRSGSWTPEASVETALAGDFMPRGT